MSIVNLMEYARRCATDPVLWEEAKAIAISNIDEQIAHATALGLPWARADLDVFLQKLEAEGDLSDEDLEQVAGGGMFLNRDPGGMHLDRLGIFMVKKRF